MNWRSLKDNILHPRGPLKDGVLIFWPQLLIAYLAWGELPNVVYGILLVLWSLTFAQWFGRVFKFNQRFFNYLSLLVPVFIFFQFKTFLGRDSATSFLLILAALKAFEFEPQKDRHFAVYLNIVSLAVGLLFDIGFLPSALVVLGLLSCVFQLLNPGLQLQSLSKRWSYVGVTLVLAIPLTIFLFYFFPRFGFRFGLAQNLPGSQAWSGFSEEIKPGSLSQLIQTDDIIFRARLFKAVALNDLYWRGVVLENPKGLAWVRATRNFSFQTAVPIKTPDYTIDLKPQPHGWLFTMDPTESIGFTPTRTVSFRDGQYTRVGSTDISVSYSGVLAPANSPVNLQTQSANSRKDESLRDERMQTWLAALPKVNSTNEKIKHLENFLKSNNFTYSLQGDNLLTDSLSEFLFDKKIGYCEHYASSMTHILRYWDVPARVVAGFVGGEQNNLGDYLTVRGRNAHAWLEYIAEDGTWHRWDPTRAITTTFAFNVGPEQESADIFSQIFLQVGSLRDYIDYEWTRFFLGFDRQEQLRRMDELKYPPVYYLIFAVGITILIILVASITLRRRKVTQPTDIYYAFLKTLAQKQKIQTSGLTPNEVQEILLVKFPQLKTKIDFVFNEYQKIYEPNLLVDAANLKKNFGLLAKDLNS